jgi:hypothetical protein
MARSAQAFPAFDDWQKMSESEQDAFLDRMETGKRRKVTFWQIAGGITLAGLAALLGAVLLGLG